MKQYIRTSLDVWEGHNYISKRIIQYFEKLVRDAGCTHCSHNDYKLLNDGSLKIELQWDGGDISPFSVGYDISSYFGDGVTYVP